MTLLSRTQKEKIDMPKVYVTVSRRPLKLSSKEERAVEKKFEVETEREASSVFRYIYQEPEREKYRMDGYSCNW